MLYEGMVTSVKNEFGVILLDVVLDSGRVIYNVAYGKLSTDFNLAPREGDVVALQKTNNERYVATCVISKSTLDADELKQGEAIFQLDEDSFVKFSKEDDTFNIEIDIEGDVSITNSGETELSTSGDISVSSSADIFIGDGGESVAIQDHTHDFDIDGEVGTTELPNEEGTDTFVK